MIDLEVLMNASAAQIRFALLAGRFSDFRPVLNGSILRLVRQVVRVSYENAGSMATPKWAPLAASTLREKARLGYGNKPIMRRTDRLFKSLVRAGPDAVAYVKGKRQLFYGTKVPYATYHQRAKKVSRRRQVVPQPMPSSFFTKVRELMRDYIIEGKGA